MKGRPSKYSDELCEAICDRLTQGESMVQICSDPEMPGLRTVMRWAAEHEAFGTEYARAREAQAEWMDHHIYQAAFDEGLEPAAARVRVDALKWRAAKLAPKRYGDKQSVEHSGPDGGAIEHRIAEDRAFVANQIEALTARQP